MSTSRGSSSTPNAPLNIPAGNTSISPDARPIPEDDLPSGDTWTDVKRAVGRIDLVKDFENIDRIPCIRNSLLYGIAGGLGLGSIRFFGTGRIRPGINWGVLTFMVVSSFQWETCRRARAKELQTMRQIQQNYKHISTLKADRPDQRPRTQNP